MLEVNVVGNKTERYENPAVYVFEMFKEIATETYASLRLGIWRLVQLLLMTVFAPLMALLLLVDYLCHKFVRWFGEHRTNGVYLSHDDLTYVEFTRTKSGEPELRSYGTRDVSRNHEESTSPDPDALKTALSQVFSTGSVACLGGHPVIVKRIHLPKMTPAELKTDIMCEAEQLCPWDIDEVFVDYHVVNPDAGTDLMEVLLIFADKQNSQSFAFSLDRAGFYPDRLGVAAMALADVTNFTQDPFDGQTMIINLDDSGSLIVSMQEGAFLGMSHSALYPISNIQNALGDKAFDQRDKPYDRPFFHPEDEPEMDPSQEPDAHERLDQMTERFEAVMEKAREEQAQWEACMPPMATVRDMLEKFIAGQYPEDDVLSTIKEGISAIAGSVIRCISVLRLEESALRVFICGKYHNLPGLGAEIGSEIGVIVEVLDPTRNILIGDYVDEKALEHSAPALAIPIGLALRSTDRPAKR